MCLLSHPTPSKTEKIHRKKEKPAHNIQCGKNQQKGVAVGILPLWLDRKCKKLTPSFDKATGTQCDCKLSIRYPLRKIGQMLCTNTLCPFHQDTNFPRYFREWEKFSHDASVSPQRCALTVNTKKCKKRLAANLIYKQIHTVCINNKSFLRRENCFTRSAGKMRCPRRGR